MAKRLPGQQGYQVIPISSFNKKSLGKLTDANHLSTIQDDEPSWYDRRVINLYTQSMMYSNDFLNMINKSRPYYITGNTDSFQWEQGIPYQPNRIMAIPDETSLNPTPGVDEHDFPLVFERKYQINDVITAHKMYGDALIVTTDPVPHGTGWMVRVALTGENVTKDSSAQLRWLTVGQEYYAIDQITGEFDQEGLSIDTLGEKIKLMDTLGAGMLGEHSITKYADQRTLRDKDGRLADILVYAQWRQNEVGQKEVVGVRWENYAEQLLRQAMLQRKTDSMLWGQGGQSKTRGTRQDVRKHKMGIYHKIRNFSHHIEFNEGEFNQMLLRDTFGDLFYRRTDMKDRRVKLFTNEAGIMLFRQMNKEDLAASGITLMVDIKDYKANPMIVHPGYDMMFSMESGIVEVSHLKELDLPQNLQEYTLNKKSPPIFFVFDITNPGGGLQDNIREVRQEGAPSMTWGYINGRQHYLGHARSKGMDSANMFPGYKMWYEDRFDLFVEDLSRMVVIEQTPQI